jgi:hypothetical protein
MGSMHVQTLEKVTQNFLFMYPFANISTIFILYNHIKTRIQGAKLLPSNWRKLAMEMTSIFSITLVKICQNAWPLQSLENYYLVMYTVIIISTIFVL